MRRGANAGSPARCHFSVLCISPGAILQTCHLAPILPGHHPIPALVQLLPFFALTTHFIHVHLYFTLILQCTKDCIKIIWQPKAFLYYKFFAENPR